MYRSFNSIDATSVVFTEANIVNKVAQLRAEVAQRISWYHEEVDKLKETINTKIPGSTSKKLTL